MSNRDSRPRIALVAASLDIVGGQGVEAALLLDALRAEGYPTTFVPIDPRMPAGLRWARRLKGARTLATQALYLPSLLRLASVDVVHVFSASYWSFLLAPAPAMLAGRALRKRVVLHYHSGEAADHLANWGGLVHPWLRLADEIVVPSHYLRRTFERHGHRATVIPNIVDLDAFRGRPREALRPRLLSVRNLEPYYRIDTVLRAFALIRERFPGATLTVAGVGSLDRALRGLASSLGPDGIRFVGRVEREAMPALYAEADVLLNASVLDNQPVTLLEAWAAGLAVVTTPAGAIPEMVEDGATGVLVPMNDPAAMAGAVASLLENQASGLEMIARARERVGVYSWTGVRDLWARAYGRHGDRVQAGRVAGAPAGRQA